jgi:2-polyprenyl-6-methoxyphenol hydroxylase-like FAD-dependent oxidoreductase
VLPHIVAGAMCAVKDAEALSFVLCNVHAPEEVHSALQRAFRIRYKRCCECQVTSLVESLGAVPNPNSGREAFAR